VRVQPLVRVAVQQLELVPLPETDPVIVLVALAVIAVARYLLLPRHGRFDLVRVQVATRLLVHQAQHAHVRHGHAIRSVGIVRALDDPPVIVVLSAEAGHLLLARALRVAHAVRVQPAARLHVLELHLHAPREHVRGDALQPPKVVVVLAGVARDLVLVRAPFG